jgi:HAD superfamily hydrolase (TIGR01509 family)
MQYIQAFQNANNSKETVYSDHIILSYNISARINNLFYTDATFRSNWGTLVNNDNIHFNSYSYTLTKHGFDISWPQFEEFINFKSIDALFDYLGVPTELRESIRQDKMKRFMETETIEFMSGARQLLECCLAKSVNFAIVTNTSRAICDFIISKCPVLGLCHQWICREDYSSAKPAPDCYQLAVQRFHKSDQVIVGFENSANGCEALKTVTRCIYCICDANSCAYKYAKNQDLFIYSDIGAIDGAIQRS